jgi:hypothetical protein
VRRFSLFGTGSSLSHLCSDNKKAETNLIPLGAAAIHRILEAIEPFSFDQIYGGWWQARRPPAAQAGSLCYDHSQPI